MSYVLIDTDRKTYSRCDGRGCESYQASFTTSGAFTNIDVPGRGMMAKLGADLAFAEVVSIGLVLIVSHGKCQ